MILLLRLLIKLIYLKILIYMIDEIIISDNTNKYRFKLKSFIIVLTGK
jgi:hypothetical protein